MRFRRLLLRVFGPHRARELVLDSDVVLVFGSNESGKSSFRWAVETIVYGFEPASRDAHPLYRWSPGEDLHLEAEIELGEGSLLRVERVLQSGGKSRTAPGGEEFRGTRHGNRPLAQLAHLPREIFRAVYSLELEQLEALGRSVQEHVDDLLLPETDELALRSISQVRAQLRRDHLGLWRPDRRGRPRARALRERLAEARERAREAAERERELRELRAERADVDARVARMRADKRAVERARDEAPYLRELFELRRAERRHAERVDLAALEGLPLADPSQLAEEIDELEERLREPTARLAQPAEELGDGDAAVLAAQPEVEAALQTEPLRESNRQRTGELLGRAEAERDEARRALAGVLSRELRPEDLPRARDLELESLRVAQAEWASAWERHASAPPREPQGPPAWVIALGSAGLLLVGLAAFSIVGPQLALLGAALGLAAAAGAYVSRRPRAEAAPPRPDGIDGALAPLAVAPQFRATPVAVQQLVETLARVRRALRDAAACEGEASALAEEAARHEQVMSALCRRLGLDEHGSAGQRAERLRTALTAARERAARVERDRGERRQAQVAIDSLGPGLERKRAHRARVEEVLRRAEPEGADVAERFERVRERLEAQRFLARRRAELETDPRWPALRDDPRVTAEEEPADAPWQPEVVARRDEEIAELDLSIQHASTRLGELNTLLGSDDGSHRARASEEVAACEEELRAVERERDRLALLESLLERAERDYREAHQPDVLRRASAYLERVTQGRYTQLDYRAPEQGGLHVTSTERDAPVPVGDPISRGTLDQIHLCLRLGLLDHLDEDRERLPLILDDALVRMDDTRRLDVYRLIQEISPRRQIFLLTCHRWIADEADGNLKARRIDLT